MKTDILLSHFKAQDEELYLALGCQRDVKDGAVVGCSGAKVVGGLADIFLHVAVSMGAQVLASLALHRPFPMGVL